MVVGFNHNFRYKGEVFHVQTEDGGLKSPTIITLLYRGGTILASKKTSYADITRVEKLEQVVEELMKEQHKEMLRRLKEGEFDELIAGRRPVVTETPVSKVAESQAPPTPVTAPAVAPTAVPVAPSSPITDAAKPAPKEKAAEPNLDDIILSYLVGDDNK